MSAERKPPSEMFERLIGTVLSSLSECDCGRIHFVADPSGFDWQDGEHASLLTGAAADPNRYVARDAPVRVGEFGGRTFVVGCKCNYLRVYEDLIWGEHQTILRYLVERALAVSETSEWIFEKVRELDKTRDAARRLGGPV